MKKKIIKKVLDKVTNGITDWFKVQDWFKYTIDGACYTFCLLLTEQSNLQYSIYSRLFL